MNRNAKNLDNKTELKIIPDSEKIQKIIPNFMDIILSIYMIKINKLIIQFNSINSSIGESENEK